MLIDKKNEFLFYFNFVSFIWVDWYLDYLFYIAGIDWEEKFKRERKRVGRLQLSLRNARQDVSAYRALVRSKDRRIEYLTYK